MSSPLQDQLEQSLAEYRRTRADMRVMQEKLAEVSSTETAPRNVVSVTVDAHGQVTGIAFPTHAYKNMAPTELANVVRDTVRKAQSAAREQVVELMEPFTPAGLSMRGKEPGKLAIDELFPENPEDGAIFRGQSEGWEARGGDQ